MHKHQLSDFTSVKEMEEHGCHPSGERYQLGRPQILRVARLFSAPYICPMFKRNALPTTRRNEKLKNSPTHQPPSAHKLGRIGAHCNCRAPATSESNSALFPQFTTSLEPFGRITFHFKTMPHRLSFPIVTEKPTLMECLLARMK